MTGNGRQWGWVAGLLLFSTVSSLLDADLLTTETINRVDAQVYYPQDRGLRSLQVTIENSLWNEEPLLRGLATALTWKAPDEIDAQLVGLDAVSERIEEMDPTEMDELRTSVEQDFLDVMQYIIPRKFTDYVQTFDFRMDMSAEGILLVGEPKPDSLEQDWVQRVTLAIDRARYVVVRDELVLADGSHVITHYEHDSREGKSLMTRATTSVMDPEIGEMMGYVANLTYEQVDGYWLVSGIDVTLADPESGEPLTVQFFFTDYKINPSE